MACLIQTDPQLSSSLTTPLVLGNGIGAESNLHMHGNFLSTVYSTSGCTEDGGPGNRSVVINYICPSENQVKGRSERKRVREGGEGGREGGGEREREREKEGERE